MEHRKGTKRTRQANETQTNRSKIGRFDIECHCLNHEIYSEELTDIKMTILKYNKSQSYRKPYQALVKKNLIKERQSVCTRCFHYSKVNFVGVLTRPAADKTSDSCDEQRADLEELHEFEDVNLREVDEVMMLEDVNLPEADDQMGEKKNTEESLSEILEKVKKIPLLWNEYTAQEKDILCKIAGRLGSIINVDIFEDSKKVTSTYKEYINNIGDNNSTQKIDWIKERNSMLLSFVKGCSNIKDDISSLTVKKSNALLHAMEQLLYTRNLVTTTPYAFQRNIIQYTITGSKNSVNLTGNWEPAGSYKTVHNYVTSPVDVVKCPPGDVNVAIDNEQRVGRNSGRIREGATVRVDICTTMSFIKPEENTNIQSNENLKPEMWQKRDEGERAELVELLEEKETEYMNSFRGYREKYIAEILQRVQSEQTIDNSDYVDISVMQKIKNQNNTVCPKCKFVSTTDKICPECNYDLTHHNPGFDPYHRTASNHAPQPPTVLVGEPYMANPNRKQTVKEVLHHVQDHTINGEDRQWVVVWSDAIPYLISAELQDDLHTCCLCHETLSKEEMEEHSQKHRDGATYKKCFGNVLLRPGPGHIELNLARAVLKLLWDPLLSHISRVFGFKSQRAQFVIRNGVDHHRSKVLLGVLLEALSCELLLHYVRTVPSNLQSATHYMKWVETDVNNANYVFIWRLCFTYILSFHLYNEGTRKNSHVNMMAARAACAPLFFGRNHPKYRIVHMRDMLDRLQCPPELQKYLHTTESFSVSGNKNTGQGADFIHEEKNKLIKGFLPPGAIGEETWRRVCRKSDKLSDMKREVMGDATAKCTRTFLRFEKEVTAVRREIRESGMIADPSVTKPMISITHQPLDFDLPNITHEFHERYDQFKKHYKSTGKYNLKITPVYITPKERSDGEAIEKKTKKQIMDAIEALLEELATLGDTQVYNNLRSKFNSMKPSTLKEAIVKLYYEVLEYHEEMITEEAVGVDGLPEDDIEEFLESYDEVDE